MQKRRGHNLPLTETDLQKTKNPAHSSSSVQRRRRRGGSGGVPPHQLSRRLSLLISSIFLIGSTLYLGFRFIGSGSGSGDGDGDGGINTNNSEGGGGGEDVNINRRVVVEEEKLKLSQFPSLQYALSSSQLVGLYFAAAWCPMSTPVSNMIDEILGEILLPPPAQQQHHHHHPQPIEERAPMSLVYISSDRNQKAFQNYHRRNWMSVPYEYVEERTAIKRQFSVCAKPEVELLGIDREYEIPTLLILDGSTHDVLTTNGAEDLEELQEKALDHWLELRNLAREMEDKYSTDDYSTNNQKKRPVTVINHHRKKRRN